MSFLRISNPKTGEVIHDSRKGDHLAIAYIGGLLIEHYSQPRTFADPNWTDADEKESVKKGVTKIECFEVENKEEVRQCLQR